MSKGIVAPVVEWIIRMSQNELTTGRNDPCPCGSGRKLKQCCRYIENTEGGSWRRKAQVALCVLLVGALAGLAIMWRTSPEVSGSPGALTTAGPQSTTQPSSTPQPWEYDAANNRHWHAGHGHWHDGPPPPASGGGNAPGSPPTPQPWEYDAANNQHWHAGHGHWHDGPPPPAESR